MKGKKGQAGEAIVWIYKIILLIIVICGIVGIVLLHYSKQYDVRDIEKSVLAGKVLECFSEQGEIKKEDFSKETLDNCLNFDEREIFLNVTIIKNEEQESIFLGRHEFIVYCETKEENIEGKNLPSCMDESYDLLIDGEQAKVNIFVAILKIEKNML